MNTIVCDMCGKNNAVIRRITRSYGKKNNLFVIENIPIMHCPNCRENYLTADTMHEIARIKMHRNKFAIKRSVPVAEFA